MSNNQILLDLEKINNWFSVTSSIVEQLIPDALRDDLKEFDPDEMYDDTMGFFVEACVRHGESKATVEKWSSVFDQAFCSHYSHIRGFHACRAFAGLDAYRTHGIRKLSRSLLRELAHIVFRNHSTIKEIEYAVDSIKIPDFEESVYFFTDAKQPLDDSCNHYLQSGSEMLQALSIKLNLYSKGILASQGEPYLIECDIPLEYVSVEFRWDLWRNFVTEYFRVEAGSPIPTTPYEFCLRVIEPIKPSSIRGFHKITKMNRSICPCH